MEPKLDEKGSEALLACQPVGTDLIMVAEGGLIYRKLDTQKWHLVGGVNPTGWSNHVFRLDLERKPWTLM